MKKIILMVFALMILCIQSCFAAEISDAHLGSDENLRYPVIKTGNPAIDDKINVAIVAEVDRFSTGIYQNAAFNDYKVAGIYTNYEIACNGDGDTVILSVLLTESSYYEKAAHPSTYLRALNFNLANGERMGINYLLEVGEGVQEGEILEKLNKKIVDKVKYERLFVFPDAIPIKNLPQDFYWDKNLHVHFIFQQYEIAPYAVGIIDIDIDE